MTKREFKFENGDRVKETITGFEGTVTGSAYYITGCNQYCVVPKSTDVTKSSDGSWYDEGRLMLIEKKFTEKDFKIKDKGCDTKPPMCN